MSDEIHETITVEALEGRTLASIIWRRFRRPMPGLVERTLALNPGLSASVRIPRGTTFRLPIPPVDDTQPIKLLRLTGVSE